ncbi:MAG: single-stranded DNA-binding protein [Anaerolineae bacterium]|nr:single-stranded DNA-binding protein [Anaerolineae bacterium]
MYHKVILIGNLGSDPQMRYTPEGVPVTTFSVATNRRWTNPDGSPGEETIWWRVTAWRKLAETCNQYLSKGRQVYVEGQMRPDPSTGGPRIWTGNDGVARASYEVTAFTVRFLGGRGGPMEVPPEEGAEEPPAAGDEGELPF